MKTLTIDDTIIQNYALLKDQWHSNGSIVLEVTISPDTAAIICDFLLHKKEDFALHILSELIESTVVNTDTAKKIFIEGTTACKVAICLKDDLDEELMRLCSSCEDPDVKSHFLKKEFFH